MKIRKCLVSNSSSSSFVCEYCGRDESGWDMGLYGAKMCECINGHLICADHMLNLDMDILEEENKDWRYELNEKYCPICNFDIILDSDLYKYLLKQLNLSKQEVLDKVKEKFDNYSQFQDYLKD